MWLEPNALNGNRVPLQDLMRRSSDNGGPLLFVPPLGSVLSDADELAYPNFSCVDQGGNSFVAYL
jgi:hypothetical protein